MDKRVQRDERNSNGNCPSCGRRHIHRDDCKILKPRWREYNDRLRANLDYPVQKVYLCERCGAPLMELKHQCPTRS